MTGRLRKVKCDEGHPACHRCVSTGRVCDGYGVWGGGGNFYGRRQNFIVSKDGGIAPWPPASVSILARSTEEKRYFEWFKFRTSKKLPGIFVSTFWDTLLLQASLSEPAVLHAVLALSSVHKREILNYSAQSQSNEPQDEQEYFMLQHYIKAIRHLQPHFSATDSFSVRVALITCVVFVCLEFLRGHFKTAQNHLQNGLKVLTEMHVPSQKEGDDEDDEGILLLKPSPASIDDWIAEALLRLHVQVELFRQSYQHHCLFLQAPRPEPSIYTFHSINEAWHQMERLLNKIFYLTEQGREKRISKPLCFHPPRGLLKYQRRIQAELTMLSKWLHTFEVSKEKLQRDQREELTFQLLRTYHAMATIMAGACLGPDNESIFDSYSNLFSLLISRSAKMRDIRLSESPVRLLPGHCMNMSRSIVDIGWIPPLYYTALKCRVHRVRIHAIRLLESTFHREGIWDAKIAACVARKVMEIEEGNFYKGMDTDDDFPLSSAAELRDLSLPTLPQSYRIQEVQVVLSNGPMESVFLICKQRQTSEDWRVLMKEYSLLSQRWLDG